MYAFILTFNMHLNIKPLFPKALPLFSCEMVQFVFLVCNRPILFFPRLESFVQSLQLIASLLVVSEVRSETAKWNKCLFLFCCSDETPFHIWWNWTSFMLLHSQLSCVANIVFVCKWVIREEWLHSVMIKNASGQKRLMHMWVISWQLWLKKRQPYVCTVHIW